MRSYCEKYKPEMAVRSSMAGYRKEEWMTNVTSGDYQKYYTEMYEK